jgi:hypothetical protein
MWWKHFFPVYRGEVGIGDGVRGVATKAETIICREESGSRKIIKTGLYRGRTAIREWKYYTLGRLTTWVKFGAFESHFLSNGDRVKYRFHPNTTNTLHGKTEAVGPRLFGQKGKVTTIYSWGRIISQQFKYLETGKTAYKVHRNDRHVVVKYKNGKTAFRLYFSEKINLSEHNNGEGIFEGLCLKDALSDITFTTAKLYKSSSMEDTANINVYDRRGRVCQQGEFRNRQRVGEWILNGQPVYFVKGVPVVKKMWDTPPEKLNIKKVLKISNVQLRMALMDRIGYKRLAEELKHKVIHEDKGRRNKLIQLPVKVSSGTGNGGKASYMRILIVTCTSTKSKYYLNVPDYIAPYGKRKYLNTCEAARQWTFGVDDPNDRIKFALET